jgi:hypothetical protein
MDMDIYTTFAILMLIVAIGATAVAVYYFIIAHREIAEAQRRLALWWNAVSEDADKRQLLNGKVHTALMDRIRDLETYRRQHTDRINSVEDMVELLNDDGMELESDWVEARNNAHKIIGKTRHSSIDARVEEAAFVRSHGAAGLSRSTDFDDAQYDSHIFTHSSHALASDAMLGFAETDPVDTEARRQEKARAFEQLYGGTELDRPTYHDYVHDIAGELDSNGKLIIRR